MFTVLQVVQKRKGKKMLNLQLLMSPRHPVFYMFSPVAGGGGHYHQEREFSGPGDFGQFWGVESESGRYSVS